MIKEKVSPRRAGALLVCAALVLSGCVVSSAQTPAPSATLELAAAVTATVEPTATPAPTGTTIPAPTSTLLPQPTSTLLPPAPSVSAAGEPPATPTAPAAAQPASATRTPTTPAVTATPRPFPTLGPSDPLLLPTPTPFDGEPAIVDDRSRPLVERASQMLADDLGIAVQDVTLALLEAVVWPDGGLGCATPDQIVQPVETPGYRIVLAAAGIQYEYHTDLDTQVVRCAGARLGR